MERKFITKPGEVLKGSTLLKKEKSNVDRVTHMIQNMDHNKAFLFNKKEHQNQELFLEQLKKNYKKYREEWKEQPSQSYKNNFLSNELKKNKTNPLCLDIEVASICDLACPFCFREYEATPDKIIDEKFCYSLIDQAAEMKIPSIKFNWRGEPLLHPKLHNFIKYAKQKGILETIINTNATHLDEKLAEKLIKSGLDLIIYSFDGGSKETYEKMRPGRFKKNNFESVYGNIKNFKKVRDKLSSKLPFTKIQMILTKETFKEVDSFFNLFCDYVDDVSTTPYTERGGNISDLNKVQLEEYNKLVSSNNLPKGTHYMKDVFGNITVAKGRLPCEQLYQRLMVTYEGKVAMCCYDWGAKHSIGYVNKKAFENKKDYLDVMKKVKENKKGFELLKNIEIPKNFNEPEKKIQKIKDIWLGKELDKVREKHCSNNSEDVEICKNCTFKDVYDWL